MSELDLFDIVTRSSAAVLCLLTCAVLLAGARQSLAGRFGSLFALGAAAYIICTAPVLVAMLAPWHLVIVPLSWFDAVFFWWFALALFCDEFRWRLRFFYPVIPLAILVAIPAVVSDEAVRALVHIAKQALSTLLILHGVSIALRRWPDDLIDARRRFRIIVAASVGLSSVGLMLAEHLPLASSADAILRPASSGLLLFLSFGFSVWALQARDDMFVDATETPHRHDIEDVAARIDPADSALLARLEAFMKNGGYKETGLTVGHLAHHLDTPEHRLRKLINQGLGYRNFSSFINVRRVEDAKLILSDPEQSRRQILQVALDLGYGSIAPFNRAFREATGEAPSVFRRRALTQ